MPDIKPVLIVEHCSSGLTLNEDNKVKNKYLMEGVFTEFNTTNRNGRVYTAPKFLPHLNELLERKKSLGVLYGEFDHPDVFDTSLSRVSHVVENAWFNETSNRVEGQIVLLSTHWGKEARSIVNDGYPIFVSSRAAGITDSVGHVELKKLFTYDCVADPGFASARMNLKSINESVGISDENVRLYAADNKTLDRINTVYSKTIDLSDETKTNELFNMNKNDAITKKQLTEYSNYLVGEIQKVKESLTTMSVGKKDLDVAKIEKTAQYYEALNAQFEKLTTYLDYLAEQVQVAIDGNKVLTEKTSQLEKHSDYLAENLEKTVNYADYLAENLDKNISYAEYIAENLDKNISYSEYLAENLDKNISYAEYIAENLDKNISYAEYLAENLDKNISYAEYIAENVSDNIKYSEYVAENLDTSIAFQEYLAENLERGIKYSEYVAECTDKTLSYVGMIAEKLNGGKNSALLNEEVTIQSPKQFLEESVTDEFLKGEMEEASEKEAEKLKDGENAGSVDAKAPKKGGMGKAAKEEEEEVKEEKKEDKKEEKVAEKKEEKKEEEEEVKAEEKKEEAKPEEKKEEKVAESAEAVAEVPAKTEEVAAQTEVKVEEAVAEKPNTVGELTKKIDMLIEEAKKREASKTQEPHFYKFLNKSQIQAFESLTADEQETIKVALNESQYFTTQDVLKKMREVLNTRQVSPEEKLVEGLPKDVQPVWESLNESEKKSIIAQSKFYVLDSEEKIENFWRTRKINANALNEGKKLIAQDTLKMNESLSEVETASFMDRVNRLK